MKTGIIKVKLYTYKELSDRVQIQVRQLVGPGKWFKEKVTDETLFLSNGTFFEIPSLNFRGLTCESIEVEQ